jgi:hypothetical protein
MLISNPLKIVSNSNMSVSNTSTLKGLIFSFSTLNRTDIRKVKKKLGKPQSIIKKVPSFQMKIIKNIIQIKISMRFK